MQRVIYSAYLLLPIHQEDRKFLRFRFREQLFQFRVLPLGLASAPYIFTKIIKPALHFLREKGFLSVVYLGDFILIAPTYDLCIKNVTSTKNLLSSLGFITNKHKSKLTPAKSCKFLGFIIDTEYFAILIPADRRNSLLQMTLAIPNNKRCKIREVASYISSLTSVCPAVQYDILHTKILEREKILALTSSNSDFEVQMHLPLDQGGLIMVERYFLRGFAT